MSPHWPEMDPWVAEAGNLKRMPTRKIGGDIY